MLGAAPFVRVAPKAGPTESSAKKCTHQVGLQKVWDNVTVPTIAQTARLSPTPSDAKNFVSFHTFGVIF